MIASSSPGPGILVRTADGNVIQGNTIGLYPDGSAEGVGVDGGIQLQARRTR